MPAARAMIPLQAPRTHGHGTLPERKAQASAIPGECAMISEKQFLKSHTMYSAVSSWLFAIAGATNIGVLCAFSSKVLTAVEQGRPLFRSVPGVEAVMGNKRYNRIALGMVAFGGACMAVSNFLESKKVVTEWQLGAGKLQRKINIAEKERAQAAADQASDAPAAPPPRNWVDSVRPETPTVFERLAGR